MTELAPSKGLGNAEALRPRAIMEAEFQTVCYVLLLRKMRDRVIDPEYWRRLNPELTISDWPCSEAATQAAVPPTDLERYVRQIREEGYLQTPPFLDRPALTRLRVGVERVVRAGFPSGFACVYDEFYRLFTGLESLLTPILGARYLMVPEGFWTFFVEVGDSAEGAWSATAPHRDSIGPDPAILEDRLPTIVNVWIPLTDATPLNSCIYLVPAQLDSGYRTTERRVRPAEIRLQDIRALPAPAGSVLAWTTHLVHWGSRSTPHATEARMSAALYFQNRNVPVYDDSAMEFPGRIPFETRLYWIARTVRKPDVFDFPKPAATGT